jgi:hypothetical protein
MFTVSGVWNAWAGQLVTGATDPIFADNDAGRWNTTDQVTWNTTLDLIPYSPADKTGRNAKSVTILPQHNPTPNLQQWNLTVGHQIKGGILLQAGYAGVKGTHLQILGTQNYNLNAIPVSLAPQAQGRFIAPFVRYPQYPSGVTMSVGIGSSAYHALQLKAERRFANGLAFTASYSYSKLIDVGGVGYRDPVGNRNLERGLGAYNVPSRLVVAYTYSLPVGVGRPWLNHGPLTYLLGGWEVSGITTVSGGLPLTPGYVTNTCVCGNAIARPNIVGDVSLDPSQRSRSQWLNVNAFAAPALYTIGNGGRGLVSGPGSFNFDASLRKRFMLTALREGASLEYKSEFYNMTNTPGLSNPNMTVGSATFAQITGTATGPRTMQMALKLYW